MEVIDIFAAFAEGGDKEEGAFSNFLEHLFTVSEGWDLLDISGSVESINEQIKILLDAGYLVDIVKWVVVAGIVTAVIKVKKATA